MESAKFYRNNISIFAQIKLMKKYIPFLSFLFFASFVHAQNINTVAGNGTPGYSGDLGPATNAKINMPIGCFVDATGNIFISDQQNSCIRKVTTSGIISTVAGTGVNGYSGDNGPATSAVLNIPGAIFVDGVGNVFFADGNNNRVRKINTSGIITTIAGNGTPGYSGDGGAATSAEINNPIGITVDASGNFYIGDQQNHRIRKVTSSGIISTVAGTGSSGYSGDGGAATLAKISYPNYIFLDAAGNLLITDNGNHCIRKINASGIISTIVGTGTLGYSGDGGPATAAQLTFPGGLTMNPRGDLYIADAYNNRVRKVNTSGVISTIAGTGVPGYGGDGGAATAAVLHTCADLSYYGGSIYIADYNNNRIRVVGETTTVPYFTKGSSDTILICNVEAATIIDSMLSVIDSDVAQTLTWSLVTPPSHGSAITSYSASSTGGVVTPSGLTYFPSLGYFGSDVFSVRVTNGIFSDTIAIHVLVEMLPDAGVISGIDSVCPHQSVTLSETVAGGIWSYSNGLNTSITFSGIVTGIEPGHDTIIYTIINSCGIVSAIFPFTVRTYLACNTGVNQISEEEALKIYPNPSDGNFSLFIASTTSEDLKIIVTNILGQKVKEFQIKANALIDINLDYTPGVYFLKVNGANENYSEKLIIR